jgi:hypothetical protein
MCAGMQEAADNAITIDDEDGLYSEAAVKLVMASLAISPTVFRHAKATFEDLIRCPLLAHYLGLPPAVGTEAVAEATKTLANKTTLDVADVIRLINVTTMMLGSSKTFEYGDVKKVIQTEAGGGFCFGAALPVPSAQPISFIRFGIPGSSQAISSQKSSTDSPLLDSEDKCTDAGALNSLRFLLLSSLQKKMTSIDICSAYEASIVLLHRDDIVIILLYTLVGQDKVHHRRQIRSKEEIISWLFLLLMWSNSHADSVSVEGIGEIIKPYTRSEAFFFPVPQGGIGYGSPTIKDVTNVTAFSRLCFLHAWIRKQNNILERFFFLRDSLAQVLSVVMRGITKEQYVELYLSTLSEDFIALN